jgi:putative transposase
VRRECLDHLLITGRRHLLRVLHSYVRHDNRHRPHRSLDLSAPEWSERQGIAGPPAVKQIHRRDVLGGLIHEMNAQHDHWAVSGTPRARVSAGPGNLESV